MKISYLGPRGTYTEQACVFFDEQAERIACATFYEALSKVSAGECDFSVAAMENSTEGVVNATLDPLIFDMSLFIEKLIILPVNHCLMAKKGVKPADIKKIISHPQALAQCGGYLRENFGNTETETCLSTSLAAKTAGENPGIAALASSMAADIYGLDILDRDVQDSAANRTSFIAVTRKDTSAPKEGCISTIAFSTKNKPGELYRVLDIFSLWDINMTRILSRPMRDKPGEYVFIADIEIKDVTDAADAMTMIRRKTGFFKHLGTYETSQCKK